MLEAAVELNPNLAWAWHMSGFAKVILSDPDGAIERGSMAIRLSPKDPQLFAMTTVVALGHYFTAEYDKAIHWGEKALREKPSFLPAASVVAASTAFSGKSVALMRAISRVREIDSELRCSNLGSRLPFTGAVLDQWTDGLRLAGLPE